MDRLLADCRARLGFDLLANTWNPVVLYALATGPRRNSVNCGRRSVASAPRC